MNTIEGSGWLTSGPSSNTGESPSKWVDRKSIVFAVVYIYIYMLFNFIRILLLGCTNSCKLLKISTT